jgi:radical SAM superfamily enzyme YgiQ (UPF0313 family)
MKILFVFPNYAPIGGGGIPIGLSILISIARQKGHEVALFDTSFTLKTYWYNPFTNLKKSEDDYTYQEERRYFLDELVNAFREYVNNYNPDIICVTANSPTYNIGIKLIEGIEEKNGSLVVFGGIHPTVCPDEVIQHESVDIICLGEGELAFPTLLERLANGEDYTNIQNLWVKKNGYVKKNEIGQLIQPDSIPLGDFSLFEEKQFYRIFEGKKVRSLRVEMSRGCVFKCSYCSNKEIQVLLDGKGRYFRHKSVNRGIDELSFYKDYNKLDMLFFKDEVFLLMPKKWMRQFSQEYKSKIKLPFFCQSTAKEINEEKVEMLKDMGCVAVAIGVEVGNEKFRKEVLKKHVSNEQIKRAVYLLVKENIRVTTYFLIGFPYETRDLIFDTIEFQRELYDLGSCPTHINCFYPFPGAELTVIAEKEGFLRKKLDHRKNTTTSGLDMPQLSAKEIEGLYRTYVAYTRVDKWMYPIIELCETGVGKEIQILSLISQHYSENIYSATS